MDFTEYHAAVKRHSRAPRVEGDAGSLPLWETLGIAGEAGEAADKVAKGWREDKFDLVGYVKELGDVLWYLDAAAEKVGFSLDEIAELNVQKLQSREARGVICGAGDDR